MNIISIGGSGLVGSRINWLLSKKNKVLNLSLRSGYDITKPETLKILSEENEYECVILYAAKADVDGCEKDKALGEQGDAYRVNVSGAENTAKACLKGNKKLVYISTDFVFDGKKEVPYKYKEDDLPNPVNWYGVTKHRGEEAVRSNGERHAIVRIAYPYSASDFALKKDFVHAVMSRLSSGQKITGVVDHVMTPTFIDDIGYAIEAIFKERDNGIYHAVGGESLSPYEAIILLAERLGYDVKSIGKTVRQEFFKGKAERPLNLSLDNGKISKLGVRMRSFREGVKELRD